MKIVIVEDEMPAAEKLERYLKKYDANAEVVVKLQSIVDAVNWFVNPTDDFDLVFMDIQLTDGLSFEIFNQVRIDKPIIFTTAFDEYAIDAFKVNSIDYLLKPITFTELSKALNKFKTMKRVFSSNKDVEHVLKAIEQKKSKERFLVRMGNHIHSVKTSDIALFYAEGRTVYLMTIANKKFILDYKLEDLTKLLDEKDFFRVNRSFIININAIIDVLVYSNSRLKIITQVKVDNEIVVSREKVNLFKTWLEGI